jgi:tetratricopeptide (TPR) repeat protein
MWHRFLRVPLTRLAAAAFASLTLVAIAAPADDLREAQKLYGQGKLAPALDKVDVFLKTQPRDPQGRFLKGLILTEQKRVPEAIQMFTGLTEDYPELPEPYNNLAVLYASQGNFDKARSALELAIHTHPSYATAYENLGDVYAQLASRSYDKALQLDKTNASAQVKLSMVKDLFSSQKVNAARAPESAPKPEARKAEPKVEPPPKQEPSAKTEIARASPPAAAVQPSAQPASDEKAQVAAAVESWARAWSAKDVRGYLGSYAQDFEVPGGHSRAAWEKQRTERIQAPKSIDVTVKIISTQVGNGEATVTFRQRYRSDTLKSDNTKTLKLVKTGDRWLIKQEHVGG